MQDGPTGPLTGLRIIDLTLAAAGPFCGMLLADLGADVIKVEPPGGELIRQVGPFALDDHERVDSGRYANRNRNKRSIVLDLNVDADRETLLQLIDTADGLIENMRAGVMDRLGVSYEVCRERNPRLVYGAIRGFGDPRTGASPYVDWPAYDVVAQSMGGAVAMTGPDPEHPLRPGPPFGDLVPATFAALGIVSALLHTHRTGEGQFLDVSMVDVVMSMTDPAMAAYSYSGKTVKPNGNKVNGVIPFDVFETADGHCAIAAPTERHWPLLCEAIGQPGLATDERVAGARERNRNRHIVDEAVGDWAKAHTNAEIMDALGGQVPVGPVFNAEDWIDDPHVAAREMLVAVDHPDHRPTIQLNCPIKFTETPAGVYRRAAKLDEHGAEIRAELTLRTPLPKS